MENTKKALSHLEIIHYIGILVLITLFIGGLTLILTGWKDIDAGQNMRYLNCKLAQYDIKIVDYSLKGVPYTDLETYNKGVISLMWGVSILTSLIVWGYWMFIIILNRAEGGNKYGKFQTRSGKL